MKFALSLSKGAIAVGLLLAAACGYQSRGLHSYRRVDVPIFENVSDRRLNEFELTETVVREMQSNGLAVNTGSPYVLQGRIMRITEPRLVEGAASDVLVSSESVTVEVKIVNRDTGQTLKEETISESAPFSGSRGQTAETARREVFDRIAKRILQAMVTSW